MSKMFKVLGLVLLTMSVAAAQEVPKAEVYLGYSFLRVNPATIVPAFTANGGIGTAQYNFNKNFAITGDFGGYHNGNISGAQLDSTAYSYLFGPKIMAHKDRVVSPFGEALFGGIHATRSFALATAPGGRFGNSQDAFAMAIGGGLDLKLKHWLAIRPVQLDYFLTRFQPLFVAGLGSINSDRNQNNLRYSAGFDFRFGGAVPPPPIASCTGTPSELLPDDPPVNVSVATTNFNSKHPLNYNWASTGGQVTGNGSSAKIDATGLSPGSYTATSSVSDPKQKINNTASCTVAFTVKQPQAPTVACSASPSSIQAGSNTPVTISARGASPDGRRIASRTFNANMGSVKEGETTAGSGVGEWVSSASLDTSGVNSGPIEVNIGVTDSRGLNGSCMARVDVQPLPQPAAVAKESLVGECNFGNARKPARVDNECKAALDDVAVRMQKEPGGKLVLLGTAAGDDQQLAAQRAVNAKEYLAGGEGQQSVDTSRMEVRQGPPGSDAVQAYWVPSNGAFTMENTSPIDESQIKAQSSATSSRKRKSAKSPASPGN